MNGVPTKNKRQTGSGGEDAACRFLESEGYRILCRNFYAGHDEIDIIAEKAPYTVFVEVKTRTASSTGSTGSSYGRPAAAVTAKKRYCLSREAEAYIKKHPGQSFYRFDVVEVLLPSSPDGEIKINHMQGVFGAQGKIWI